MSYSDAPSIASSRRSSHSPAASYRSARASSAARVRGHGGHAARLSTVGGFPSGSGRDTFITWSKKGGNDMKLYKPGERRPGCNTRLRGSVNNRSPSYHHTRKKRTISLNPTGRFRPRAPKIINDHAMPTYGKPSITPGQFSVEEMFRSHRSIEASPHRSPKDVQRAKTSMVRRHVKLYKGAHAHRDPVKMRRQAFLAKSRERQEKAAGVEMHTGGRRRVKKMRPATAGAHRFM